MAHPGIIFAAAIAVGLALWYFLADPEDDSPHVSGDLLSRESPSPRNNSRGQSTNTRALPSRESPLPRNNSREQSTNARRRCRRGDNEGKDDCSICTDPMDQATTSVACGHMFHSSCIQQWREIQQQIVNSAKGNTCPICRSII